MISPYSALPVIVFIIALLSKSSGERGISGPSVETINLSGNKCDFRSNNRTLTNDMI